MSTTTENSILSLKALSIRQPWAWLVANGYKTIENRNWPTNFRGEFLIHAGKLADESIYQIYAEMEEEFNITIPPKLDFGGIIGRATLTDCVEHSYSDWFYGPYGFVIENARPLNFYPCRGQLKFFKPDLPASLTMF